MKIKIDQEENTSNMLEALLKLERQQPMIKTRWILLPLGVFSLMYIWQQQFFTGWVLLPFIWSVVVMDIAFVARSRRHKLEKIERLKIDPIIWDQIRQQYPELGLKQRKLIEQGFKDYLALHAMQKQGYAMPSHAVDLLWHTLLEHPQYYKQLCKETLGRALKHQPHDHTIALEVQRQQLFESWRYSCMLHEFNPRNSTQMPRLFAIDRALNWNNGQYFELEQMTKGYAKYLQDQSSSSSSCGSSCSSCGGGGD